MYNSYAYFIKTDHRPLCQAVLAYLGTVITVRMFAHLVIDSACYIFYAPSSDVIRVNKQIVIV